MLIFSLPFAFLLLLVAVCPLLPHRYGAWWDSNRNKFLVSVGLSLIVMCYYTFRGEGVRLEGSLTPTIPGTATALAIFERAILEDYLPFICLLFCLYTVGGGIRVVDDVPAHPLTNTMMLGIGAVLANLVGTTGASMLLIRPVLQINSERKYVSHTVVFFIFIVSNVGGCLTPVGDPPLFLGYLHGVPFLWTLTHLWPMWLMGVSILLAVYYAMDHYYFYKKEPPEAIKLDEAIRVPMKIRGAFNLLLMALIVAIVATVVQGQPFLGTAFKPPVYLREGLMLAITGASYWLTPRDLHRDNGFSFGAINEVGALFLGIFLTMSVPMELLDHLGETIHLTHPAAYFWASGTLSSVLDNAPTYLIFFELGKASSEGVAGHAMALAGGQGRVLTSLLTAVSLGSVFMGANTYIGNGPNFMVKKIAEETGVKMPTFFGYMVYSGCVLIPLFLVMTVVFFRH